MVFWSFAIPKLAPAALRIGRQMEASNHSESSEEEGRIAKLIKQAHAAVDSGMLEEPPIQPTVIPMYECNSRQQFFRQQLYHWQCHSHLVRQAFQRRAIDPTLPLLLCVTGFCSDRLRRFR